MYLYSICIYVLYIYLFPPPPTTTQMETLWEINGGYWASGKYMQYAWYIKVK